MLTTNPANGASKANASTRTINQLEQLHQLPPRLAGNTNSNNTSYPAQRTRSLRSYKPLTISTQKPMGTGSIAQMHGNTGSGQEVNTPTSTRTPRSASVRRKPVAAVPCSPVTSTPPSATGNNKLLQSRVYPSASLTTLPGMNKSRTSKANSNTTYDQQDMNGKLSSAASFVNGSHINFNQGWNTAQNSSINGDGIDNTGSIGRTNSGSSKRKISNESPRSKNGGGGGGEGGGGNVSQRFGEFLSAGGSLLGSKKRGSDISLKSGEPASSPSSSVSSLNNESSSSGNSGNSNKSAKTTGTMLFAKKDTLASSISPKAYKSSILSSIFNIDSRHQQLQQPLPHSPSRSMYPNHNKEYNGNSPLALPPRDHSMDNDNGCHPDHSDAGRGRSKSSWDMIDDDKIVNWELNKTVPTSHYEDEAFGLWIRPNHEARTTISGADVEKAEKEDANGRDTYNYPGGGAKKKKNKPELEDMEVLEEVLDFSIIILMRASASLYPFIASAHSKSIPFIILWRSLQYMERSIRHHNIRTLKDYQDHVMADIGCAIQAMNEIYDQQERPFGHPDNFGRDTKPRLGVRSPPVIIPPNRAAQANSVNGRSKGSSRHGATTNQSNFGNGPRVNYASNASLHIQSPQKQSSNQQHTLASSVMSPFKKHRRHISVPASKPTITSMITSIKQSIPSPISMHSTHSTRGNNEGGYSHPYYSSYPDGTPFVSGFPPGAPTSYSQADSQEPLHHSMQHSFTSSMLSNSGGGIGGACGNYGGSHYSIAGMSTTSGGGGFLPQSIQTVINSFRHSAIGGGGHSVGGHSLIPSASSQFMPHPNNLSNSPVPLSKQEEKRLHLENQWRVDIMRRKAHLRGWACRAFMTLYEFSLQSAVSSLQEEFRDLYRIIRSIVEVDATATEKSHEVLAMVLAQAQEHEREPFQLRYSHYNSPAPTGKEIREANEEAIRRFEALYKDEEYKKPDTAMTDTDTVDHDNRVAPWIPIPDRMNECMQEDSPISSESLSPSSISSSSARTPSLTYCSSTSSSPTTLTSPCYLSAYDNMDLFGLQRHTVWDPLMDRLTKFDTTHHELDARNIFHFFRRMSLDSPSISEPPCQYLLSDEARDELLAVLWVLEKCVRERPDAQQSPTWFRLSSSASAVQAVFQAGGVIPYLKELQRKDPKQRDPIQTVHPVTLTGYFKRLLKDCGGLLLKETTALFVELARPATDNGDFWNLEKLSQIDRALLYRVICLDYNRGRVFLRISRVMEQILESSPKDMELDAFALSKMVQVVELSGVLDLKALRRWNGAWSSIILGYM